MTNRETAINLHRALRAAGEGERGIGKKSAIAIALGNSRLASDLETTFDRWEYAKERVAALSAKRVPLPESDQVMERIFGSPDQVIEGLDTAEEDELHYRKQYQRLMVELTSLVENNLPETLR